MKTLHRPTITLFLGAFLAAAIAGCGSEKGKLENHLTNADGFFESGNYGAAEIEYLNAINLDNDSAEALARLGIIYHDQGRAREAYAFLDRAKRQDPGNQEVSRRLAYIFLAVGERQKALAEGRAILDQDPSNPHGPIILANSLADPSEADSLIATLSNLESQAPENPSYQTALGLILARLNRPEEAEAAVRRALVIDPSSAAANSALGNILAERGELDRAEDHFHRAMEASPARSSARMQLITLYFQKGDLEKGRALLEKTISEAPNFVPALLAQAKLLRTVDQKASLLSLNKILRLDPIHHDAMVLRGVLLLATGEVESALEGLSKATEIFPQSPDAHYELARSQLATGDTEKAASSVRQCLDLNPDHPLATILLSRIQFQEGNFRDSIVNLEKQLEKTPDNPSLQAQLAAAHRRLGNYEAALSLYDSISRNFPNDTQALLMKGQTYVQQNDIPNAVRAYEEALKRDANLIPALDFLTSYYLSEERFDFALDQISQRLASQPDVAAWHMMKAKVEFAQNKNKAAEDTLLKAVALEPDNRNAYLMLTQLYLRNDNRDAALARLKEVIAKNPKDIPALMIMSGIYESQQNWESARYTYEKILSANAEFGPALNNLAYLYSIHLDNLDRAHELAEKARRKYPIDPSIADTLGWIKYQLGDYDWARTLIQESSEKLPDQPEVLYHLGSVHYMLGNESEAKTSLEKSLASGTLFAGREEAERRLGILNLVPSGSAGGPLAILERTVKDHPQDPVALTKLAQSYDDLDKTDQALEAYDSALSVAPNSIRALLGKARLLSRRGDTDEVLNLARAIYEKQSNDPSLSSEIGRLAYLGGDHAWSANLLQEAARRLDEDKETLIHLADALFATGKIVDARKALAQAGEESSLYEFLKLVSDRTDGRPLDLSAARALAVASRDSLAQLWVDALSQEGPQPYEALLEKFPSFTPAKRELAIQYTLAGTHEQETYNLVNESLRTYRNDSELVQALGILEYSRSNYSRAASLLTDGEASDSANAKVQFFLGMALYQSGNLEAALPALNKAIDLGLSSDNEQAAKSAITEVQSR